MSLFRAACWLGLVLAAGSLTGVVRAAEAEPETALAADLRLPGVPDVQVRVDREDPGLPAVVEIAVRAGSSGEIVTPPLPEVIVAVEPAEPTVVGSTAPAAFELRLPPAPEAPVAFTPADLMADALAARLADSKTQLHPRLSPRERDAIAAFYAIGGFKPLWIKAGGWSAAALTVIERLEKAEEDGLDPIAALADLRRSLDGTSPSALAEAELKLSAAAALYARDARGARIEPGRLSRLITPKLDLPAADAVLTDLASARDAGAALARYNPSHPGYRALRAKLAELRGNRLSSSPRLEADLLANMERWRWLPSELGRRHILVNVPEYRLRVVDQGRPIYEARVIVGKPETPTPLFSDVMEHAIVNPSWTVPPSIFKNEFFSDPAYAASRGYQVLRTKDGISIRQPPGERNALGFIKFMFPNQHAVYLHDTPNRNLFGAERRAFSHGCVRLDQPFRFGQLVLGAEWTEARLRGLIGKGERTIRLPEQIPVHLAYFTVVVDESGQLRQLTDLYAVNNKVRVALGLPSDGTKVAEAPRPKRVARPAPRQPTPVRAARRLPVQPTQTAIRTPAPIYDPPFGWWVTR